MSKQYYCGVGFWNEKNSPLNEVIIKKAESRLNIKFPNEYINLLKESNGGTLYYTKIDVELFGKCKIPYLLGIDLEQANEEESEGIFSAMEELKEQSLPENILLLAWETYPHSCFALDYSNCNENPEVVYFYENYPEENTPYSKIIVAPNFEGFLSKLYHQPLLKPSQIKNTRK